jgi:hypothetical protein
VDLKGDCRFDRSGDRLTITVPGRGHGLQNEKGKLNAPHLLREIKEDCVVQVRVAGNFRQAKPATGLRRAGLLLTDGKKAMCYARSAEVGKEPYACYAAQIDLGWPPGARCYNVGPALDKPGCLRLELRFAVGKVGPRFPNQRMFHGVDGRKWEPFGVREFGMGRVDKVMLGVYAETTAPGTFKVVFDQFKLAPLRGKAR